MRHRLHRIAGILLVALTLVGALLPTAKPFAAPSPKFLGPTNRVALSPDGKKAAIVTGWGVVRLYNLETGDYLRTFGFHPQNHPRTDTIVFGVAFSPDGKTLLLVDNYYSASLWDVQKGQFIGRFGEGIAFLAKLAGYTSDGNVVTIGWDDSSGANKAIVRVWSPSDRKVLQERAIPQIDLPDNAALSPDGKSILLGDGKAELWDLDTGKLIRTFPSSRNTPLGFSPDGTTVVLGNTLWDTQSGNEVGTFAGASYGTFSPDGKRFLVQRGALSQVWDLHTRHVVRTWNSSKLVENGQNRAVGDGIFSTDGKMLLLPSITGALLLDVESGLLLRSLIVTFWGDEAVVGHYGEVTSVAFAPDGKNILVGSTNQTARQWDVQSGIQRLFVQQADSVTSVAYSPDGTKILTGSLNKAATLWDARTGKRLHAFNGHLGFITYVAFAPDGKTILTGSMDGSARLWDIASGDMIYGFGGQGATITSAAYAADSKSILTGNTNGSVNLWDVKTGDLLRTFGGHQDTVTQVAFSPDGKRILSGSLDGTAKLWEAQTGELLRTVADPGGAITSAAYAPDGKTFLTGSVDGTARRWDVETGSMVRAFTGHKGAITSVAFAPDGKSILTGSLDATAQIWDIEAGTILKTFAEPCEGTC